MCRKNVVVYVNVLINYYYTTNILKKGRVKTTRYRRAFMKQLMNVYETKEEPIISGDQLSLPLLNKSDLVYVCT